MAKLLPFTGHVVADHGAHAVVAPPYDALTPAQRTAMAAADPRSFLNVLPPAGPEAHADLEHTLHACRRNLDRLLQDGHFQAIPRPTLVVVALGAGADRVIAIVGDLEVSGFGAPGEAAEILPHERVDGDRVAQLVRYLEVVGVASSPVALTHRPHPAVTAAAAAIVADAPDVAFRGDDGMDVALWLVTDPARQADLVAAVDAAGRLFVADGHHRAAAVAAHEPGTGRVLSALLPADQLRVLPFHRRVHGLGEPLADMVLDRLRDRGLVPQPLPGAAAPDGPGRVHLVVAGTWWALDLRDRAVTDDPVEALDVRLAEREIVAPLLAATTGEAGAAGATVPVPAPQGLAALEVPDAVGIALAPPDVEQVLRVAEAGATMPPKTTYVLPKLRSGMLVVPR
ncbi:DUF1015 family protein [Egicoccus sp. AB-alg2]|uniref:DUF1015 family protein n=1 Tax=Egicoccus sp. AB-alg2 TaxID=3242693 RepID=UPI00359D955A